MATIANLGVSLTARIGNFEKGFKKARKTIMRFGSDLARHTKTIARYGLALASVAAGALSFMIKRQFDFIDSTTKTAEKLGLTTEALIGMQHAAELSGVPINQLELGIQRMTRRLAEAGQGLGEAQGAIKTLGLDADSLNQLSPDQQFLKIADAMEQVQSQSERVRLGFKLFDSEGVALINVMRGGADAVREYMQGAEELGLTFDSIEANKIEQANDAITRMKAVITGAARTLAIQLAPFVEFTANKLRDMGKEGEGAGAKTTAAFNNVIRMFAKVADWIELLKAGWHGFVSVVTGAAATLIQPARAFIKAWQPVLDFFGLGGSNLEQFFDDLSEGFTKKVVSSADKAAKAMERFNQGFHSKQAEELFDRIQSSAQEVSRSTSSAMGDFQDMLDVGEQAKTGQFRQVDLKRVAIGGVSGSPSDKGVNKKQGDTMIQRLSEIARNTANPKPAVVA